MTWKFWHIGWFLPVAGTVWSKWFQMQRLYLRFCGFQSMLHLRHLFLLVRNSDVFFLFVVLFSVPRELIFTSFPLPSPFLSFLDSRVFIPLLAAARLHTDLHRTCGAFQSLVSSWVLPFPSLSLSLLSCATLCFPFPFSLSCSSMCSPFPPLFFCSSCHTLTENDLYFLPPTIPLL